MFRKFYFAHPVSMYNTELESRIERKFLNSFPDAVTVNPNRSSTFNRPREKVEYEKAQPNIFA